ncbi:phage tail fiber protein [Streptomyces sp. NPDC001935]
MTDGFSSTLVSNLLNTLRSAGAAFGPVATYVQLHTASPGAAGTTAVSAGSSSRIAATLSASSGGSALALSADVGPWTNAGTSETITHISVWTASSGGTFEFSIALTLSKPWAAADTFLLKTLGISLAPQAT